MNLHSYLHAEYRYGAPVSQRAEAWEADGPAEGRWLLPQPPEPEPQPTERETVAFGVVFAALMLLAAWGVFHHDASEAVAAARPAVVQSLG